MTVMLSSVRQQLRAATDETHQALHSAAPFVAMARGPADLVQYGQTLRFLHRYHTAMAPLCAAGAAALALPELGAAHAARIAALVQDLAHLGLAAHAAEADIVGSKDFGIGALYTVQGSTLGGKLLHRQLDGLLPDDDGRRFFKGTAQDGRNWQALCAGLETRSVLPMLEAGARYGFARFAEIMMPGIRVSA